MIKKICLFLAVAAMAFGAHAQALKLNSGAGGGTYHTVTTELLNVCGQGQFANTVNPGGSPKTITDILDNQIAGGLVQFDVLWMRSRSQNLSTIKTLFPMHTEQVHLVALNKPLKSGGFLGVGGNTNNLSDIKALNGLKVGASGGSMYTAQAVNQLAGLGYLIDSSYPNNEAITNAIKKGDLAAGFIVAGAPAADVRKLSREFRLIPFDAETAKKLSEVYRPKAVVYDNLGTASINTVEVDALMVVNDYKGKTMKERLLALRECAKENATDLAETPGHHASWRSVNMERTEPPKWPVYGN